MKTQQLLDGYINWFTQRYSVKELKEADEITTPFTNHLNDRITLYIEFLNKNKIKISDDGITLDELDMMGININVPTRKKILETIIKDHGLTLTDGVLFKISETPSSFAQNKHDLIQGILSIYDILFTSKEISKGIFHEEVLDYFFENEFAGTPKPKLLGASGITHNVDYSLGATKKKPQILIKLLNDPSFKEVAAQQYISNDLKEGLQTPKVKVRYVIIANDSKKRIPDKSLIASEDMGIDLIPWSNKEKILQLK